MQKYHELVGHPYFPPLWALGYHQGSMLFDTLDKVEEMVELYRVHDLLLEGIWLDRQYLKDYWNFQVSD